MKSIAKYNGSSLLIFAGSRRFKYDAKQMKNPAEEHLRRIFQAALDAVDPGALVHRRLTLLGDRLEARGEGEVRTFHLSSFQRVVVLGAGKAAASIAAALEQLLGERITGGLIVVKDGYALPLARLRCLEAGHPVPDSRGEAAAAELERLAELCDERTLVLLLMSGGGSALLPAPLPPLSLQDKQAATRSLLACGAGIREINCVRKHLSRIKGGRLAQLLYPATVLGLILSDVVGDRLDAVASGPAVGDASTYTYALEILDSYGLRTSMPAGVLDVIGRGARGELAETPKPGDPVFSKVHNLLLGTNRTGLEAAARQAEALGYRVLPLSSRVTGEAREVARVYAAIALDPPLDAPLCILGGGETTVTVRGTGRGGRNQECALAFLQELAEAGEAGRRVGFLSASTDGSDGPTDAAGAFATLALAREAESRGLRTREYLANNDSYGFFREAGGLLHTGPTHTNVCDYQICLLLESE
jgi:hydroxypyruvate reductase